MNESSDAIKTEEVFVSLLISTESQISDTPKWKVYRMKVYL